MRETSRAQNRLSEFECLAPWQPQKDCSTKPLLGPSQRYMFVKEAAWFSAYDLTRVAL